MEVRKLKKSNIVELTFLICWPVAIVASLVIYLMTNNGDFVVSYILGIASMLLMQSLNYRIMKDLYKNNPSKIKGRTILMYIVRFVFFGIILYVSQDSEKWNVFYTLGGLLTYPITIFVVTLIKSRKDKGDDEDEL